MKLKFYFYQLIQIVFYVVMLPFGYLNKDQLFINQNDDCQFTMNDVIFEIAERSDDEKVILCQKCDIDDKLLNKLIQLGQNYNNCLEFLVIAFTILGVYVLCYQWLEKFIYHQKQCQENRFGCINCSNMALYLIASLNFVLIINEFNISKLVNQLQESNKWENNLNHVYIASLTIGILNSINLLMVFLIYWNKTEYQLKGQIKFACQAQKLNQSHKDDYFIQYLIYNQNGLNQQRQKLKISQQEQDEENRMIN